MMRCFSKFVAWLYLAFPYLNAANIVCALFVWLTGDLPFDDTRRIAAAALYASTMVLLLPTGVATFFVLVFVELPRICAVHERARMLRLYIEALEHAQLRRDMQAECKTWCRRVEASRNEVYCTKLA